MISSQTTFNALLGAAFLVCAAPFALADKRTDPQPLPSVAVDGFPYSDGKKTHTNPFTLNLDGTPTEWMTAAKARPQPPRATDPAPKFQSVPAPAGADILFDGTAASRDAAWEPARRDRKIWVVKEVRDLGGGPLYSVLEASNRTDIDTKKAYGDARLHIEWRAPVNRGVHGQQGTNSGVMFGQGRYEIQVLDSYNNFTYPDGMAGAIYAQFPPKFNAALPRGEWQSYDITFTAPRFDADGLCVKRARFTVVFNGVVVQDDQELVGDCSYRNAKLFPTKEFKALSKDGRLHGHPFLGAHPSRLPLRLQFHSDPIQFRNIWIQDLEKAAAQ
ncbi:MAG: DUF1080 domain-containing protein [Puniceicoccales bacterium]|jgi:hypothetical protein|nr:DUF1080 domain-containing protein [Puniceicoccales bacterium]